VIGGSVGVGTAFGLTGEAAGFSAGTGAWFSCPTEISAIRNMIAPVAISLRRTIKIKSTDRGNCVYLAERTCNASNRRGLIPKGPNPSGKTNPSQVMFPDIIRNLGSYPAQTEA
jgi:hypothetical protein